MTSETIWGEIFTNKPQKKRKPRPYICKDVNGKWYKSHKWTDGINPKNGRPCDLCSRCGEVYHG